jgi:hypothetical protein
MGGERRYRDKPFWWRQGNDGRTERSRSRGPWFEGEA